MVDIKPDDMEELSEVITAATFHPHQSDSLVYSSSKGVVRMCDLRERARCTRGGGRPFGQPPATEADKSFFSELISSTSDVKFSRDGRPVPWRPA